MSDYPFQVNDRVYIMACPDNTGTVSAVDELQFTVSWDSHNRPKREARLKFSYNWENARLFKCGNPTPPKAESVRETDNG